MLKEALEYLKKEFKETEIKEIDGVKYATNNILEIQEPTRETISVSSLTGLVDFIQDNFDNDEKLLVNVIDESFVEVKTLLSDGKTRDTVLRAFADVPEKKLNHHIELEEFNIQLQAQFVPTNDSREILDIISHLNNSKVKTTSDNGMTQSVEVKQGVTGAEDKILPNPVTLKPFRTFTEIAQPESLFVFRLREMNERIQGGLFEADGGAWKNEARLSIKEYLEEELTASIEAERVLIIG